MKNFFTSPLFKYGIMLIAFLLLMPMIAGAFAHPVAGLLTFGVLGVAIAEVNTPERAGQAFSFPVAATTKIWAGTLVALDSSGNAVPASNTSGLKTVGRAEETIDNTGSAGDLSITVKRGVFLFANSVSLAVDPDDKGKPVYVEDDMTVAESASNSIVAGICIDVTAAGVWIDTVLMPSQIAAIQAGAVGTTELAASAVTAAKLADAVADKIVTCSVAVANTGTPDGVAHVTLQAKDAQGNSLAASVVLRVWFAATALAAPADLGTLTAATGTLLKEDTDDALATVLTDAAGLAVLALDLATDGTVHAMAEVQGVVVTSSAAITGNA